MTDTNTPRELHPIARHVLSSLEPQDGRRYALGAGILDRTRRALEGLAGSPELRHAVLSLVSVAKVLEELGSKELTTKLLDVASAATNALLAQGASAAKLADDLGTLVTKTFAAFNGQQTVKSAPTVTGRTVKAAPGTISVASMAALHPRRA